jgi:NDP-sugar pyrophosphorylase family protein
MALGTRVELLTALGLRVKAPKTLLFWYDETVVQAVVLAGGLATRMRPQTLTVPKSLLEVAGRPFVDWQLERLAACGYESVIMCVGYLGDQVRDHVGDGARLGIRVDWSEDTTAFASDASEPPKLLGTAGAIRSALDRLDETFLVTYGDSYLPFDYADPLRVLDRCGDCDGVMAVYRNAGQWDTSNVITDGAWVLRYDKGQHDAAYDHIDYGATALRREVIACLEPGRVYGLDVVQRDLAARKRLRATVARDRFFEIGSPDGLAELDRHLRTATSL